MQFIAPICHHFHHFFFSKCVHADSTVFCFIFLLYLQADMQRNDVAPCIIVNSNLINRRLANYLFKFKSWMNASCIVETCVNNQFMIFASLQWNIDWWYLLLRINIDFKMSKNKIEIIMLICNVLKKNRWKTGRCPKRYTLRAGNNIYCINT